MCKISKHLILTLLCITSVALPVAAKIKKDEIVCKSTTVRSIKDFNQLQNCTIVAGHVHLVQMHFTHALLEQVAYSNIEEITGYLLVYRVEGLESLEILFPKLIVIRGVDLLYDQYALVVIENLDLVNIGLVSLLRILRGSIRVESNPSLCFTDTINWITILGNDTKKYNFVIKNNKPPSQCPLCFKRNHEIDSINEDQNNVYHCWSQGKMQRFTTNYYDDNMCTEHERATSNCLTSCSDKNCRHCKNFVTDKGCSDNCLPPRYYLAYKRQCVSNCKHLGLISFGSECVEKCPRHHQVETQNGQMTCVVNCTGNFKVNTVDDLEGFSDCTFIQGSLTIELFDFNKPIINHLEEAFKNLNEITGYLRILRSPQIISLIFFKNLHTIRGENLIEDTYALYVVDNHHLEKIWNTNQKVAILHGRVYFHLNPRLCYSNIMELQQSLRESHKISVVDASRNSNGERVVCMDYDRVLSANVSDYNSNSALIVHELLDSEDLTLIIGYIYYYKEAPEQNLTRYDGRHGCGQDSWFMDITKSQQIRHIIKDLKPNTQYAYFVKPMTVVDYHYQMDATSEIQYFRTLPAKPGAVARFFGHSISTTELEVFWWPPRQPNGVLEKYILNYELTNLTKPPDSFYDYYDKSCMCPKLDSELSGGTPNEEDYYKKEEVIYTDALYNFMLRKDESRSDPKSDKYVDYSSNKTLEEIFELAFRLHQERAIRTQEGEKHTFLIDHPFPICDRMNPSIQYQSENKCIPLESFDNSIEVSAQHHSYKLNNLEPGQVYSISIRACVQDLANGCGPEKVIYGETVSKSMDSFLKSLKFYKP